MEFYPFLFIAVHFVLLLFPSTSSVENNNFTDLSALLAFKAHVSDPYNILSTNWTANTSFCTWICGTIAPHIANLSFLTYLHLANNSLGGPIPDSIAQMPHLKFLGLENNQLSGSIPPTIFNMSLITTLYLQYNNLSGTLPSNHSLHSMLPAIQSLNLAANQLSGNISSSLFQCHNIRRLSLAINQFSGKVPLEFGNLQQLRILYLGGVREEICEDQKNLPSDLASACLLRSKKSSKWFSILTSGHFK